MKVRYRQTFYAVSLLTSDIFMILAGLKLSYWLKFSSGLFESPLGVPDFSIYAHTFGLVAIIMIALFRWYGLYVEEKISGVGEETWLVIRASSTTFFLLVGFTFFYRNFSFSRGYLMVAWVVVPAVVLALRILIAYGYLAYRRLTRKLKEIILIGANHLTVEYFIRNQREPRRCAVVTGILDDRHPVLQSYKKMRVLGRVDDLEDILSQNENINEVIVTVHSLSHHKLVEIMTLCEKYLVVFKWSPDILGLIATRMDVRHEMGLALLSIRESPLLEWENRLLKRVLDFILSLAGLVVLSPLFLLIAAVVKYNSPGELFYRQERVGEDGKTFTLIKFRTMKSGAETATGPVWAKKNDDRRTRPGIFLRKMNLDELPQLWNVLKGDMSLVGPRPERPHFVGQFREHIPRYMGRHRIKSGLTGWAQVHGLRGDTSIVERTKYDLYYIENWSIFLDLKILFKTCFAFKNAY